MPSGVPRSHPSESSGLPFPNCYRRTVRIAASDGRHNARIHHPQTSHCRTLGSARRPLPLDYPREPSDTSPLDGICWSRCCPPHAPSLRRFLCAFLESARQAHTCPQRTSTRTQTTGESQCCDSHLTVMICRQVVGVDAGSVLGRWPGEANVSTARRAQITHRCGQPGKRVH